MAAIVSVPATSKVLVAVGTSPVSIDLTILRTRGIMTAHPSSVTADRFISGAFGIMIVTDIAAAAGIASIPGPATDAADDGWLVHEWFMSKFEFGTAVGVDAAMGQQRLFDSKAKRILEPGHDLVAVVENLSGNGVDFGVNFRCLDMVRGTR